MGSLFSHQANLIIIGLDNSGKTAILNRLKQPNRIVPEETTPTIGYQKEEFSRDGVDFEVYDMSGEEKYRDLWTNYASKIHGIIFVVDAADRLRLNVAASELETMLEDKLLPFDAPVLVLANKSDMKEALPPKEIAEIMRLKEMKRLYSIHKTCALNGEGLETAIEWLTAIIKKKMDAVKS